MTHSHIIPSVSFPSHSLDAAGKGTWSLCPSLRDFSLHSQDPFQHSQAVFARSHLEVPGMCLLLAHLSRFCLNAETPGALLVLQGERALVGFEGPVVCDSAL